jgi:hypothetical protein
MSQSKSPLLTRQPGTVLATALLVAALAGCGSAPAAAGGGAGSTAPTPASGASHTAAAGQAPVPAQSNPPGDIPDTTVYVTYHAPAGHMSVKVPEGWSRTSTPASSTFTSNLNSINLAWTPMAAAPTVSSARATVRALQARTRAFRLQAVRAVTLAGGPAVEIIYLVNSTPNPVTGRQYRLVIERFEFYRKGHGAVLSLSSAVGSDNVDPWRIVSESFRWA